MPLVYRASTTTTVIKPSCWWRLRCWLLLAALTVVPVILGDNIKHQQLPEQKNLVVKNESGSECDLYWIDSSTSDAHAMNKNGPLKVNSTRQLNSFVGHVFECRQRPINDDGGECRLYGGTKVGRCSKAVITITNDFLNGSVFVIDSMYRVRIKNPIEEKNIIVKNDSGAACDLYYIDSTTGEEIAMKSNGPVEGNGERRKLNSFNGHVFECRQKPNNNHNKCVSSNGTLQAKCHVAVITIPEEFPNGSLAVIDRSYSVMYRYASLEGFYIWESEAEIGS